MTFSGLSCTHLPPSLACGQARRLPDIFVGMKLSARNHLVGKIEEVRLGNVMAHVTVRVGQNLIDSVITRQSAEEMNLKVGDTVAAIIKSTEVMLQKD
jgi:molybdopterin-binding protein